jgi:hypothetical protein
MLGLCCVALLLGAADGGEAPGTWAPAEDRLLVFDTDAPPEMDPTQKALYDDLFEQALGEAAGVAVVGRRDLRALIEANSAIQSAPGCTNDACMLSIAELVNVRFFLTGRFSTLEKGVLFAVRVYDRQRQSVVVRRAADIAGDQYATRRAIARLAAEVVDGLRAAAPEWHPQDSLWQRLDTFGKIGVGLTAAGIVGIGVGVLLGVAAADESSSVQALPDGRLSDQRAAGRARTLGWAANGTLIAGATLGVAGALLTVFGWSAQTPAVGVSVGNEGVTARVQMSF